MSDIIETYTRLLIKQYYEKPKARATVELFFGEYQQIADVIRDFVNWLDVDETSGIWLDVIGNIVQLPRRVPNVLTKNYFGFSDNVNAKTFDDLYNQSVSSATFYDANSNVYGDYELDDALYRKLLKVKIAKNNVASFMCSDERISIQDVIEQAFSGEAYVVDNQDMSLALFVSPSVSRDDLRLIIELDLLPQPIAVQYKSITIAEPDTTFGFNDNPNSKGFGDLSNSEFNENGGFLAEIYINE